MKLELPETKSNAPEKIENFILEITPDGAMTLNGESVQLDNLEEKFKQMLPDVQEKSLVLKADKNVSHGNVVKVMDLAKLSGLEKIVIATKVQSEN